MVFSGTEKRKEDILESGHCARGIGLAWEKQVVYSRSISTLTEA